MQTIGITVAFLGGALSLLPACGPALLPAFFAIAFREPSRIVREILLFMAGFSAVFLSFGLGLKAAVDLLVFERELVNIIIGSSFLVLGLMALLGNRLGWIPGASAKSRSNSLLLGFLIGLGIGGCASPIFLSITGLAALSQDYASALMLLISFELGMFLPFTGLALLANKGLLRSAFIAGKVFRFDVSGHIFEIHSTNLIVFTILFSMGIYYLWPAAAVFISPAFGAVIGYLDDLNYDLLKLNLIPRVILSAALAAFFFCIVKITKRT